MKKLLLFVLLCVSFTLSYSQNQFNCSSHLKHEEQLKSNPEYKENQRLLELETLKFINDQSTKKTTTATYVIPVVFHVIYSGSYGNISTAQIQDQINILNKEFLRQQADTSQTPSAFKPMAAPFSVEFRLATIDPSGNCTNGINRIYSSTSVCSVNNDAVKALSYWPSNKYLNIWLVETMHYGSSTTCNGGGYATFPGGTATLDGINIRSDLIGSIGTAATNGSFGNFRGRYLIHELGHWFNLRHIWGDTNCGNDFVSDTPPAETDNSGCPSFPHNAFNTCGSNADGEMFTNYMDYTNGSCLNMFSVGQVTRMTAAINSSASGRNNLWKPANLLATGTNDPYNYPVSCTAIPEIFPNTTTIACVGDSVRFTDMSYGGSETSRTWNFFGNPASSLTDSIVKVQYNAPGIYNVSLTTNYLGNVKTKTFTNKVYILDNNINANYTVPFTESFETGANFSNNWVVVNKDNDATTWQNLSTTSYSGTKCIGINNFNTILAPAIDELISPAFNLSAPTATLTFKLHYAAQDAISYDKLQVYTSVNCGRTWLLRYSKLGTSTLKTVTPLYTSNHIPPVGSSEWRQDAINLVNNWGTNPIRFKFVFTSGGGNNIFIDDINLTTPVVTSTNKLTQENGFELFPNPATNDLNITYKLKNNLPLQIEIIDVLGKTVCLQNIDQIGAEETTSKLNINTLSNGLYFIKIKQNNSVIYSNKFIKQHSN